MVAAEAVVAGVAGHVVGDNHPVAFTKPINIGTGLHDGSRNFMAQHHWCSLDAVPLHDIAAADSAGLNLHK